MKKLLSILFLLFVFSFTLFAQTIYKAKVVGIVDGDTITILDKENRQSTVRLAGIDAPERKQDFGSAARTYLSNLIFSKKVTIVAGKTDRYGRTIAVVLLDGKDINQLMIEAGFAWHYKEYENEQTEADRKNYAEAEIRARKSLIGLWQQPNAITPSEFRKAEKSRSAVSQPPAAPVRIIIAAPSSGVSGAPASNTVTSVPATSSSRSRSTSTTKRSGDTVYVDGYTRKDGTYVAPHTRRAPRRNN